MHIVQRVPRRVHRRMYLASERQVVNGVGLGEVDGLFNVGKMFTRMFTFKPHSFDLKNIVGAVGSVMTTVPTLGLAPKQTGQHGKVAQFVGGMSMPVLGLLPQKLTGLTHSEMTGAYTGLAVAAVVGGVVAAPALGLSLPSLSSIGSGAMSMLGGAGKFLGSMFSGIMGGGGSKQQGAGETSDQYYERQRQEMEQARISQAEQDIYNAQVRAQQAAMYQPGGYSPSIPFVGDQYAGAVASAPASGSYGDLRTPYTAITEDGQQVQVDPTTGQIVSGMSMPMMIGIGGIVALGGWYLMSGSKSTN